MGKFDQKVKIICLGWNMVLRLIWVCRIQRFCSLVLFQTGNTLFELNLVQKVKVVSLSDCNWTRTQKHLIRKQTINRLVSWQNDWVFVYELSGSGLESSCSHLSFRFRACFKQGVPWHSECGFTLKRVREMTRTHSCQLKLKFGN